MNIYKVLRWSLVFNPGYDILELYNILVHVQFAASKRKLDIRCNNIRRRVTAQVAEKLKTLGNQEILQKLKVWETQTSVQPLSLSEINFNNNSQKTLKIRYQGFLVLPNLTGFFYSVPNHFSKIT